jgi:hypothetical protein
MIHKLDSDHFDKASRRGVPQNEVKSIVEPLCKQLMKDIRYVHAAIECAKTHKDISPPKATATSSKQLDEEEASVSAAVDELQAMFS